MKSKGIFANFCIKRGNIFSKIFLERLENNIKKYTPFKPVLLLKIYIWNFNVYAERT